MMENSASTWSGIPQDKLTDANREHIELLCHAMGVGPWNIRCNWLNVAWGSTRLTQFPISIGHASFATTDGDMLSRLVFAAHDRCIRVTVEPWTFRHLRITMHSGRTRGKSTMSGHPTLEEAVTKWREHNTDIIK